MFLIKVLKSGDSGVRPSAASALGNLGQADEQVIAALVQALKEGESYVQRSAASALVKLGQAESVRPVYDQCISVGDIKA